MSAPLSIVQHFTGPNELGIVWSDGTESYLDYVKLRNNCPCANCEGEPDVLGRVQKPNKPDFSNITAVYDLKEIEFSGGYALKLRWRDGHKTGLYSYDLLRKLGETSSNI